MAAPKKNAPRLYVPTEELATLIEEWILRGARRGACLEHVSIAGTIPRKSLAQILDRHQPLTTLAMADRVVLALDTNLWEVTVVDLPAGMDPQDWTQKPSEPSIDYDLELIPA